MTGLKITDVSLVHGDGEDTVTALDKVSLTVEPGEFVAILGPSGSGKSSLLAVAGGLTSPTEGSVTIGDVELVGKKNKELSKLRRENIGFVFQSSNLVPALTSLDQLKLPATFGKFSDTRDPLELLQQVGMEHKADKRPHQLSGGERQRVGIARALVVRPQVLLVDEPTAALDRARSQEVVKLIADETKAHGVATVMVTHDHDVIGHCDAVYEMVDGTLTRRD